MQDKITKYIKRLSESERAYETPLSNMKIWSEYEECSYVFRNKKGTRFIILINTGEEFIFAETSSRRVANVWVGRIQEMEKAPGGA